MSYEMLFEIDKSLPIEIHRIRKVHEGACSASGWFTHINRMPPLNTTRQERARFILCAGHDAAAILATEYLYTTMMKENADV